MLSLIFKVLLGLHLVAFGAAQYSQVDYTIFDLKDSLETVAPNETFYSVLGLEPNADATELTKAYRKTSLQLHPDKNPDKRAHELYALVTSIITILKDDEGRSRYDHFLYHGFPVWRGTGYYYRRFRPGLGFVIVFIIGFVAAVQYLSAWVYYFQNQPTARELNRSIEEIQYKQFKSGWKKAYGNDKVSLQEFEAHKRIYVCELLQLDPDYVESLQRKPQFIETIIFTVPTKVFKLIFQSKQKQLEQPRATQQPPSSSTPVPMSRSSSVASNHSTDSLISESSTVSHKLKRRNRK